MSALATVPPPKRALDTLHESYALLGLDDSKPLTHESLRAAYKRAAIRVHPDKGGSPEAFDEVTRAFTYVQEVLNKLIPRAAAADDARLTAAVTPETAARARAVVAPVEDAPPIALNPKKLDMALFNKLFEENKLPDPDKDDGYGDWLKTHTSGRASSTEAMRGKYNKDMFNKLFEDEARRSTTSEALTAYKPPSELMLAPGLGTELGADRPAQYTKVAGGAGIGYTDLKHAYGDGSTFSQEVSGVSLEGRPKTIEQAKMEYGSAPRPLTAEESAAVASVERAREEAERQRRMRLATRDVDAEAMHTRLKNRLLIR
jgi:curved DNA-binding protein CbpA